MEIWEVETATVHCLACRASHPPKNNLPPITSTLIEAAELSPTSPTPPISLVTTTISTTSQAPRKLHPQPPQTPLLPGMINGKEASSKRGVKPREVNVSRRSTCYQNTNQLRRQAKTRVCNYCTHK